MIPVRQGPEPAGFDATVRQAGQGALLELVGDPEAPKRRGRKRKEAGAYASIDEIPGKALPDKWTAALPDLREAYRDICAYLAMRIHPATGLATVDHFKPKSKHQTLAYEWCNLRLAAHQVNTNKGEHEDVLDPFEIQSDWFALDIGTFEVVPGERLSEPTRAAVVDSINRLKLNEPTFCDARAEFHDRYLGLESEDETAPAEPLSLSWLERECPFVASELRRQERLRPPDRTTRERPEA